MSNSPKTKARGADSGRHNATLSPRQRQVHDLMLMGKTRGQIARRLGLSMGTVKIHVAKVFRKKGVSSKVELLVMAHAAKAAA